MLFKALIIKLLHLLNPLITNQKFNMMLITSNLFCELVLNIGSLIIKLIHQITEQHHYNKASKIDTKLKDQNGLFISNLIKLKAKLGQVNIKVDLEN